MRTIEKHYLRDRKTSLLLPEGAKIIAATVQHGVVIIWTEQNTLFAPVYKDVWQFFTGESIPDGFQHAATAITDDAISHIYEEDRPHY